jgi:hypothetical protein
MGVSVDYPGCIMCVHYIDGECLTWNSLGWYEESEMSRLGEFGHRCKFYIEDEGKRIELRKW